MLIRILLAILLLYSLPVVSAVKHGQQEILATVDRLEVLNRRLADLDDENAINALLEKQAGELEQLMQELRSTTVARLPAVSSSKEQALLESRMSINQERGNKVAVLRDKAKLENDRIRQSTRDYLVFLIQASADYSPIDKIVRISQ